MRQLARLLVALIPLYVFIWWMLVPVPEYLYHKDTMIGLVMLLGGVVTLAVAEGMIFKLWLLPLWAQHMSERLYAGSYLPEDDPLVILSARIIQEHATELIPELTRMVEKDDPGRVRAWLELAHVLEAVAKNLPLAAEKLLLGARCVKDDEDAAMLMWRAMAIYKKIMDSERELSICKKLVDLYPFTSYGKLAVTRLKDIA